MEINKIRMNVIGVGRIDLNVIRTTDEKHYEPIEGYFTLNASKLDGEGVLN